MTAMRWILLGALTAMLLLIGCRSAMNTTTKNSNNMVTTKHITSADHQLLVMEAGKQAQVRFVSHKQQGFDAAPSINDESIALNVAAAFTLDTETMDVCGDHVVAGELIKGYSDITATGHALVVGNKVKILHNNHLEKSIQEAIKNKGYLFQQCLIIEDGKGNLERIPKAIRDRKAHIIFRAACLTAEGRFAIVQGGEEMYCNEFIDALVAMGIQQALYLDMGTWAWGWVRDGEDIKELATRFGNTQYQSNWLQLTTR